MWLGYLLWVALRVDWLPNSHFDCLDLVNSRVAIAGAMLVAAAAVVAHDCCLDLVHSRVAIAAALPVAAVAAAVVVAHYCCYCRSD